MNIISPRDNFKAMRATIIFLILSVFCFEASYSQTFAERNLKTEVKEVTLFLKGAQVFEKGSTTIPSGNTILKVSGLSPYIDVRSIQAKGEGNFTILSVNHRYNYLDQLKKSSKVDSLRNLLDKVEDVIAKENSKMDVIQEKKSLIKENKTLGSQNAGVTVTQLRQTLDFYDQELTKIKESELRIRKVLAAKNEEKRNLERELSVANQLKTMPVSEIEIRVSANQQVRGNFTISYLVGNAGWLPKYDIRVNSVKEPLKLIYKADVFQNTGVDWKDAKLRFSNADPNQSGQRPDLKKWELTYERLTYMTRSSQGLALDAGRVRGRVTAAEDGSPLPGITVIVKGTTIGTITDINGNYSITIPPEGGTLMFTFVGYRTREVPINSSEINVVMDEDVTMLQEVVVTGYGVQGRAPGIQVDRAKKSTSVPLPTAVVENQTTVEIELETPYTLKSTGEKLQVDLITYEIEAEYRFFAVPKLDKDAFLVARVVDWDQYNLLEGEANLFFENSFVGSSLLDARSMKDTLDISLGRDKSVMVTREKVDQFSKRQFIGSNKIESRGFVITVRNSKSQPVNITIYDQIPVAIINDITVNPIELTKGKLDEKTGQVTWELEMEPRSQNKLDLQYEVKYPRRERVILE